ncbi:MAG: hypothetical protein HGA80_06830 [Candidatus Omnitrophica bacterium]|nr:hypothetical protein [Candidatus Omnitrophota bacterium]
MNIALGSLAEVDSLLGFSRRLGLIGADEYLLLDNLKKEVGILLGRLHRSC